MSDANRKIRITPDGPILVEGGLPLAEETMVLGPDGEPESWSRGAEMATSEIYALCRCGKTGRRPYCDGTHVRAGFVGTETAPRAVPGSAREITRGPELDLADVPCFCAIDRHCHREGDAWTLTEQSDDPHKRRVAVESAGNCPSGRITALDKATGEALEPAYAPSVGLIRDVYHGGLGPIWVKGRVPIEGSAGRRYEVRNRVTLCRCGKSGNKPFCDGSHVKDRFGQDQD